MNQIFDWKWVLPIDQGKKCFGNFCLFGVRIKPSCDYTVTAGLKLMCPSSWASNSDHFPFFWILCRPKNERVRAFLKIMMFHESERQRLQQGAKPLVKAFSSRRRSDSWNLIIFKTGLFAEFLSIPLGSCIQCQQLWSSVNLRIRRF